MPIANGILDAINVASEKFNLPLLDKVVLLSSDVASVDSSNKSELISLFHEENEWII